MKIIIKRQPRMSLARFADKHKVTMMVGERDPGWARESKFFAHFEPSPEIMRDGFLVGSFGDGATPNEAIANFAKEISGKRIVFNAYRKNRKEIDVPILSFGKRAKV